MLKSRAQKSAPTTRALLVKTLGAASLSVMVVFSAFIMMMLKNERNVAEQRVEQMFDDFGTMTAWAVSNWLQGRVSETEAAAKLFQDVVDDPSRLDLLDSEAWANTFAYRYVGDELGNFRVRPHVELTDFDPRPRPWYLAAKELGDVVLIPPYEAPVGEITVSVAVPIFKDGKLDSVLGTDFLIQEMISLLSSSDMGGLGYLFLVDNMGQIIAHPDEAMLFKQVEDLAETDLIVSDEIQEVSTNSNARLISFRSIPGLPGAEWQIGVSIDKRAAFAQVHQFRTQAIVGTIATVAIMLLVLGFVVDRLLARPLERSRQESESANVAKSEFLANMSHEIRTPMNGVLGMAEILTGTDLDSAQREYVETIERSGTSLLSIINDILDFSKFEAGKMALEHRPFDIQAGLDDVASLLGATARDKGIELIIRYAPEVPERVVGDVGRLRQIVTNLCGNAIKFTEKGHVLVDVSGKFEEGIFQTTISVADTGIGIGEEQSKRVFDQFTQAESSTTRRYGGTGLGLTISRHLARAMGGDISLQSTIGQGSTFTVVVPLAVATAAEQREAPIQPIDHLRILSVDDIIVNRRIHEEQLRGWGASYALAASGAEALAKLNEATKAERPFDVLLLDFQMPGMDGLEVARRIRENPALSNTRIIVLSSADGIDVVKGFAELGVDAVLTKPVRMDVLRRTIVEQVTTTFEQDTEATEIVKKPDLVTQDSAAKPVLSILVAEDNAVNQLVIGSMLKPEGCMLTFAENGQEAVDLWAAGNFDLILMDISMPILDGMEATKEIRAQELASGETNPISIVALTAHAMAGDRERIMECGMSDYLSKPVRKDSLLALLTNLDVQQSAKKPAIKLAS